MHNSIASQSTLAQLKGLFSLIRAKQWIKNTFVAAPLLFSGAFLNPQAIEQTLVAFLLFCLASSATYIINDMHDIEHDRIHPKKSTSRPLAAGIISISMARIMLIAILFLLILAWFITPLIMFIISMYLGLTLAYTYILKEKPVIDLFALAIGFVLRVYAGAVAIDVPLSSWMFITTLCLALYLASIKRREEYTQHGTSSRSVLEHYSASLLDHYAEISATGALLFYSMYVMSTKPQLVITIPFVLFGLFRYAFIATSHEKGESPTDAVLTDWPLIITVALWTTSCAWILLTTPSSQ